MAFRGHWLFEDLRKIDSITPITAEKYWYALRHGVLGDSLDDDLMRETVISDTQPSRVQRMLSTLFRVRPDLRTPAIDELIGEYIPDPEPLKHKRKTVLPTVDELRAIFDEVSAAPTKQNMSVWTVLRLSLADYPLRVGEMASIRIDDCKAPNNLNLRTGILTLREHKNSKRGSRVYEMPEFTRDWVAMSMRVFGKILPSLITNKSGKSMSADALTKFLNRQKVKLGSQTVRPIITTAVIRAGTGHDARESLAHKMGHSRGVQLDKYFRF